MMLRSILVAVGMLPVFHEDKPVTAEKNAQLAALGAAVHAAARTPDEAAFLLAWSDAETKNSLRIARGHCYELIGECDRGRARGPGTVHQPRSSPCVHYRPDARTDPGLVRRTPGIRG